jgi:hypothetical protein
MWSRSLLSAVGLGFEGCRRSGFALVKVPLQQGAQEQQAPISNWQSILLSCSLFFHLTFRHEYLLGRGWFRCWLKRNVSKSETVLLGH